jgi:ferredoxin--NADP+ reductase
LGRRGPAQAAYSPAEIKEIGEVESADLIVDPKEAVLGPESEKDYADPQNKKNVDYVTERARLGEGGRDKKVRLRFCVSPVEVIGADGRVVALRLERNRLTVDAAGNVKASGTGEFETIPVGLVFRSVGYRGIPIAGVPFDERAGKIPNLEGRVLAEAAGSVVPAQYVVGWAKRGPSGLIGTNRADSVATIKVLLDDSRAGALPSGADRAEDSIPRLLAGRGVRTVTYRDWKTLDRIEVERGAKLGKVRQKFSDVGEMLSTLDGAAAPAL